jgi:predicted kinase
LNTRNKENHFLSACLEIEQKIVIDNTNPTIKDRTSYIQRCKERNYKIIGYYFNTPVEECIKRNDQRSGRQKVPRVGILATKKKLVVPTIEEGFDELIII